MELKDERVWQLFCTSSALYAQQN